MGLDLIPIGKPKAGFEKRFQELFAELQKPDAPKTSLLGWLLGKPKLPTRDELLAEWFDIQIEPYETIQAPKVGRDKAADDWIREKYKESDKNITEKEFIDSFQGYYVVELAKEQDGIPVYIAAVGGETAFRGKFLEYCEKVIDPDLVAEAWESKMAEDAQNYGQRLLAVANRVAAEHNLDHLKDQRNPPEPDEDSLEFQLHIVFSLARWLIFWGQNGHGYEANF